MQDQGNVIMVNVSPDMGYPTDIPAQVSKVALDSPATVILIVMGARALPSYCEVMQNSHIHARKHAGSHSHIV